MSPPAIVTRYTHSTLQTQFAERLAAASGLENLEVRVLSSRLADLDRDGEADDAYGTALLRVGSRFKSFIYLMRADGATRFLENSGEALNPGEGLSRLSCMESRPWLCPATLDRAVRQIRPARVSALEYDAARAGLELVIRLNGGRFAVVNSLELFAGVS